MKMKTFSGPAMFENALQFREKAEETAYLNLIYTFRNLRYVFDFLLLSWCTNNMCVCVCGKDLMD